jgi:hypothetical protein
MSFNPMSNHLQKLQARAVIEIKIELLAKGQVRVTYPINKSPICLEMLKEAAIVIRTNDNGQDGQVIMQKAIVKV